MMNEINQHIIQYVNNSFKPLEEINTICYCTDDHHFNCTKDELGPVYLYPLKLIFSTTNSVTSAVSVEITY